MLIGITTNYNNIEISHNHIPAFLGVFQKLIMCHFETFSDFSIMNFINCRLSTVKI
jgi:hypothetical protein